MTLHLTKESLAAWVNAVLGEREPAATLSSSLAASGGDRLLRLLARLRHTPASDVGAAPKFKMQQYARVATALGSARVGDRDRAARAIVDNDEPVRVFWLVVVWLFVLLVCNC